MKIIALCLLLSCSLHGADKPDTQEKQTHKKRSRSRSQERAHAPAPKRTAAASTQAPIVIQHSESGPRCQECEAYSNELHRVLTHANMRPEITAIIAPYIEPECMQARIKKLLEPRPLPECIQTPLKPGEKPTPEQMQACGDFFQDITRFNTIMATLLPSMVQLFDVLKRKFDD